MSESYESAGNKLVEATNASLALLFINQPGGAMPDVVHEHREPVQLAQAGNFDALNLLNGDRKYRQVSMDTNSPQKVEEFGSIQSIDLPKDFRRMRVPADTGYISMDEAPKLFQKQGDEDFKIGLWNRKSDKPQNFENLKEIFSKPAHQLTDDEYFKISEIMTPGPWSGNGRGHEIAMATTKINGKDAIVYDYWMGKDPSKDTPMSKPGPDDIRCRVFFVPNERDGKVDVLWMRAQNANFAQRAMEFDNSLHSIRWK